MGEDAIISDVTNEREDQRQVRAHDFSERIAGRAQFLNLRRHLRKEGDVAACLAHNGEFGAVEVQDRSKQLRNFRNLLAQIGADAGRYGIVLSQSLEREREHVKPRATPVQLHLDHYQPLRPLWIRSDGLPHLHDIAGDRDRAGAPLSDEGLPILNRTTTEYPCSFYSI